MKTIRVKGISSKGTERSVNYTYPSILAKNDFEALQMAICWADEEYTHEWDENGKRIPGSLYKEYEQITSIEIIEE